MAFMKGCVLATALASSVAGFAATGVASAAPMPVVAQRDLAAPATEHVRWRHGWGGAGVAAGALLGLGLGAAIAGGNGYYEEPYAYYGPDYDVGGPAYAYGHPAYRGYYGGRTYRYRGYYGGPAYFDSYGRPGRNPAGSRTHTDGIKRDGNDR
jgi:hypothetical protein